jgi:chromosome segregation ATPase
LRSAKEYIDELEEGAGDAVERIDSLEQDLASARETIKVMTATEQQVSQDLKTLQNEALNSQETARQMEDALEEAEQKMMNDEEALSNLRSKVAALERDRQREANNSSLAISRSALETGPTEEEYKAIEQELDDANREVAKLTTLLSQSPARRAMEKAKDTKIEMLEREKEELLERNRALRMTFNEMSTPSKVINTSGISPFHRQVLAMSLKTPRTPGAPLRDVHSSIFHFSTD